jgi:hypothetical protein
MQITHNSLDTNPGPNDWFTGLRPAPDPGEEWAPGCAQDGSFRLTHEEQPDPAAAASRLSLAFRRGERHRRDGRPAGGATPRSRGPCSASSAR